MGSGLAWGQERGILSPLLWLSVTGRPKHTPHPGSKAPRGDPYLLQIVSHNAPAHSVQPPCVSWVLIHPKSVAAFGPCLWLWLFAMPFPLTAPWPAPLSLRTQAPTPPQTCPSTLRRSSRPIALHPGARFPSLLSFLMSSQFYSCSWTLGSPRLHKIQALCLRLASYGQECSPACFVIKVYRSLATPSTEGQS